VSSFHKTIIETLKPLATLSRKTIATRIRHPSLGKQGEVGEALVLAPVGAVDAARELHDALVAAEMLGAGEGKRAGDARGRAAEDRRELLPRPSSNRTRDVSGTE
jgi:hypothetical protein